jgi:hypothetical protein
MSRSSANSRRQLVFEQAFKTKQVTELSIDHSARRLDLQWTDNRDKRLWASLDTEALERISAELRARLENEWRVARQGHGEVVAQAVLVGREGVKVVGRVSETVVRAGRNYYILPGTRLAGFLEKRFDEALESASAERIVLLVELVSAVIIIIRQWPDAIGRDAVQAGDWLRECLSRIGIRQNTDELVNVLTNERVVVFDPSMWGRQRQ